MATTLDEWSITAEPDEVPAGTITFDLTNAGAEPHELVAGDYVLFCTIVETEADGTIESHLEEGMVSEFTVSS